MGDNNGTFDGWSMRPKEYFQVQDRQITRGLSLNGLALTSRRIFKGLENHYCPKPQTDSVHGLPTGVVLDVVCNPCCVNIHHVTGHTAISRVYLRSLTTDVY